MRAPPMYAILAVATLIVSAPRKAQAQFEDVPTRKDEATDGVLAHLKDRCRNGSGEACYAMSQRVAQGDFVGNQWALVEESCKKRFARACDDLAEKRRAEAAEQARLAEAARREEARRAEAAAQAQLAEAARREEARRAEEAAQARLAEAARDEGTRGAEVTTSPGEGEKRKPSKFGGLMKGLAIVGAGVAAGVADPNASEEARQQAMKDAMAVTADLVGEKEAAAAFRGQSTVPTATQSAATDGASPKYATGGFTGSWAYSGAYALHARYLLTRVSNWQCPTGPQDGGTSPRLGVRPSSQRDRYVAAAVTMAFGIECYSRQGEPAKAAEYEPSLRNLLDQANALCSDASAVSGRQAPATLGIWGCPPPYR